MPNPGTARHNNMASQPSCTIEEIPDNVPDSCRNLAEFDKTLSKLLSKCGGDGSKFLAIVFGFLQRESSYFKEGDTQKAILDTLKQVGLVHNGSAHVIRAVFVLLIWSV